MTQSVTEFGHAVQLKLKLGSPEYLRYSSPPHTSIPSSLRFPLISLYIVPLRAFLTQRVISGALSELLTTGISTRKMMGAATSPAAWLEKPRRGSCVEPHIGSSWGPSGFPCCLRRQATPQRSASSWRRCVWPRYRRAASTGSRCIRSRQAHRPLASRTQAE